MTGILNRVGKRISEYLINRYFGRYVNDFKHGVSYTMSETRFSMVNIQLITEALNEMCDDYNLPFEVLHGFIESVVITVPWSALLSENVFFDVKGLRLVIQPKERPQDVSMFDSMWGSTASSLQLAQECLELDEDYEDLDKAENIRTVGLENMAHVFDAVFANMKIRFQDSSLKIQYILPNQPTGISLEIKIASAEYFDEAGVNVPLSGHNQENDKESNEPSAYTFKNVVFEGISLFTAEFMPEQKTFVPIQSAFTMEGMDPSRFVPGSPEMPPTHTALNVKKAEPNLNSDPVLISKLNGQQRLRLKLKKNEAVAGPKVDVEFNFGALNLFLTPQQVHLLLALINGLNKPKQDISKKVPQCVANKPMREVDYALVEQELLKQQLTAEVMSHSLKNQQGWSSHSLDESDVYFHLMTMDNKASGDVTPSTSSQDDMLSSMNSDTKSDCAGNSHYGQKMKSSKGSSVRDILTDPLSELTHFHGCISSLLVIILHDDSVQETFSGDARSNVVSLKVQAETFFTDLLNLQMSGLNFKDFASVREPISKLCETNHLRLMSSGIVLDGNETSSSTECILKFNVSFHQFEVLECLFNSPTSSKEELSPKYMQLITFMEKDASFSEQKDVCFKLSYSQVECISQNRMTKPPVNQLDIEFGNMICDVDISITDRIRTLLNFSNVAEPSDEKWEAFISDVAAITQPTKTEVTLSSSSLTINLRFPIPDLRPVHNLERAPWWQQNVHKEILVLVFQKIKFKTTLDDEDNFAKYEIQCQDVHGLLKMSNSEEAVSFLRVSVDPDLDEVSRNNGFDWPRLVINRMIKVTSPELEGMPYDYEENYSNSYTYTLMDNLSNDPSPFCSTSVVHDRKEANSNIADHDEIIKPSDKGSMTNFMGQVIKKSEWVFDFTLSTVNIVFPDKSFFELLFNRISSDLLLWQNTSLSSTNNYSSSGFKVHIPGLDANFTKSQNYDCYPIFEPFSNADSNSDSDEEENLYMSFHDQCEKNKSKLKKGNDAGYTKFSLSFSITRGSLLVNIPLLDDQKEPIPDQCGKLKLHIAEGMIFIASSYRGDPNESYLCLLAEKSALYHEGASPVVGKKHPTVQPLSSSARSNLKCIIYESDAGTYLNPVHIKSSGKEMLKFAVHIMRNPEQEIKTFKIAIGISGATLRHYMLPSTEMWINQMIDFMKVQDFPVNGYVPPAIVTELHLNLSNCAIDYRPFRLPFRTALTIENFNMSCNMTATAPTFIFRIISEELRLFISNIFEVAKIDIRKNYVCVIDTGLIDIAIKTIDGGEKENSVELSIANNKVHIRTCADSFKALLDLINYLSCNGDMDASVSIPKENENINSCAKSKVSESETENLNMLMAEAMKECNIAVNGNNETNSKKNSECCNTDDEFCILEDDPGVGLMPRNGEPEIRRLTDEPIIIIDNHFSVPPGKSDVLKAPKGYPDPIFLIKLQEMALIWHLYGGSDFKKGSKKMRYARSDNNHKSKHGVTFANQDSIDNESASFCNVTPLEKIFDSKTAQFSMENVTINPIPKGSSPETWLHKGGPGRNHDVLMELQMNKVQFQREIYPSNNEHASRCILLINDIEIRDRLAASQINKFLYQYTNKYLPRQSHANMISVKAEYTRPDPKRNSEECSLTVSCKPLRLNVDQDSLMFLVNFFQEVLDLPMAESSQVYGESDEEKVLPFNISQKSNVNMYESDISPDAETFYRYFSFAPDVLIRIDYHGKRVQMEQGALKGLILGLGQLNASEIRLKRLNYRHGLLGHHKLISYAMNEWQQDILKNQLPSLLGGVGPMHSFVQLFQGVKDLFYLPVAQYQRDGQIVRGLQRGASSFSTSTVIAALDLTSRFFSAVQGTAQVAYDMVSPGPRKSSKYQGSQENYRKNSQPADIIEGVATAYNVVKEGLEDTARTIYRVASTEHEHKGVPGAVGGVLRQIPPSLFKPIILGSEATSYVLDGVRHQLMPDAHQEDIHKWRMKNN